MDRAQIERLAERMAQDPQVQRALATYGLEQKQRLLRAGWKRRFDGADGLGCWDRKTQRLIHSYMVVEGDLWSHLSMSHRGLAALPSWEEMRDTWWLLHPATFAVIVIAPASRHVNLDEVHHAWGNLTRPAVPDFTFGLGTI